MWISSYNTFKSYSVGLRPPHMILSNILIISWTCSINTSRRPLKIRILSGTFYQWLIYTIAKCMHLIIYYFLQYCWTSSLSLVLLDNPTPFYTGKSPENECSMWKHGCVFSSLDLTRWKICRSLLGRRKIACQVAAVMEILKLWFSFSTYF